MEKSDVVALANMIMKKEFNLDDMQELEIERERALDELAKMFATMPAALLYELKQGPIVTGTKSILILADKLSVDRASVMALVAYRCGIAVKPINEKMVDENNGERPIKRSTGWFGWRNTVYRAGVKYLTRSWIGRLRFHYFHHSDIDDSGDSHDHPWPFWTFPLTSYVEEVTTKHVDEVNREIWYTRRLQVVPAFRWNYRPAEHNHRVMGRHIGYDRINGTPLFYEAPIMTIVWRGKECRE